MWVRRSFSRTARLFGLLLATVFFQSVVLAEAIKTLRFSPPPGMTRAELRYLEPTKGVKGVLVLCPGCNEDGAGMFNEAWKGFARRYGLALVGLSFASRDEDFSRERRLGYFYAEKGSGDLLKRGIREITGRDDLPVVIFGFSYGGQFAHRFAYQNPGRVKVWCSYGSDVSDEPVPKNLPPGVFACGLQDTNLPSCLDAFLAARRAKGPVCWFGVPRCGHTLAPKALDWVREYFGQELDRTAEIPEVWRMGSDRGLDGFLVKCRLPSESCAKSWDAFQN